MGQRIAHAARTLVLMRMVVLSQNACVPLLVGGAIVGSAAVATDRRSTGAQLDDEVIENTSSFAIHERFKGDFHVNVTSFNGLVLLTGEVPSEAAKAEIGEMLRTTAKV